MNTDTQQKIKQLLSSIWVSPSSRKEILTLLDDIVQSNSLLAGTKCVLERELVGKEGSIQSLSTEVVALSQQLTSTKAYQVELQQTIDTLTQQEADLTLELNKTSDAHRLDQSTLSDLKAEVEALTKTNLSLLGQQKAYEGNYDLAVVKLEMAKVQCDQAQATEQSLSAQVAELQNQVDSLNQTLSDIPNKDLWLTRDAELVSLRTALTLALSAVPNQLSICDQIGKGCILHTGCMVIEAKRALSSTHANKLVARIKSLEHVVSQSHLHSLDYKCVQCDSLKQAKVELTNLDASN